MKKICIITATRAEYGILAPVIKELRKYESNDFIAELVVTGTHLSEAYGMTVDEIREDGNRIDHSVGIPVNSGTEEDISHNQAIALEAFTELFIEQKYDAIVLLGDRYETLAMAIAAGNTRTPVFHMGGGDTTEGAIDEWIRHSITKISYLHFTSNEESRKRVIQLGEDPKRVLNVGSTSIDNIINTADLDKGKALDSLGLADCIYALCTYHPVTLENNTEDEQIRNLLDAIRAFPKIQFITTKSNADKGGARVNKMLDESENSIDNLHVYASLGARRYLSLMRYAEFVLGNSSSGIIEAPAFQIPTVNIGDRQRGRLQVESIINCGSGKDDIINAIETAISDSHRQKCKSVISPYGDGRAAERIAKIIAETVKDGKMDLKKKFYDVGVDVQG